MRRTFFYGWVVVAVTSVVLLVTAGWIAIIAGFAALAIRRRAPMTDEPVAVGAA